MSFIGSQILGIGKVVPILVMIRWYGKWILINQFVCMSL